ncbi:hypothetical protein [Paenalkalicoccus suaedae]|nr:hypothetical protein [Paenalkalicoccus suaedae]
MSQWQWAIATESLFLFFFFFGSVVFGMMFWVRLRAKAAKNSAK